MAGLRKPAYFLATPLFRSYCGLYADTVLADPCMGRTGSPLLYEVTC